MSTRGPVLAGAASLIAVLGLLALTATPALANSAYGPSEVTLGSGPGEGAGQLELAAPVYEQFGQIETDPEVLIAGSGVAVNDKTHDVYVADTGNRRVDEFTAEGEFVMAFGKDVGPMGEDTCTTLSKCKAGKGGFEPGELAAPKLVTVDNSATSASRDDVYVGTGVGKEAANELQFVEVNAATTSGTFTLTVDGKATAKIPYVNDEATGNGTEPGPDAIDAEKALEEVLGPGAVHVGETERGSHITGGLDIEFEGTLAQTAVPLLGCDPADLTPAGGTCLVNIVRGGSRFAGEVVSKFSSEGKLEESWGDGGPGETPDGQINGPVVAGTGDYGAHGSAEGLGTTTKESETITGVTTSAGAFAVGQGIVSTAPGEPKVEAGDFPPDTVITAVGAGTLTVSNPAVFGATVGLHTDTVIANVLTTSAGAFESGQAIEGAGIPAETTIVAVGSGTLTLSTNVTAGGIGVAITAHTDFGGKLDGIAVDSAGNLWVADESEIYEFEEDGKYKAPTGRLQDGASASGLAVDGAGNLYLANACVEELGYECVSAKHEPDPTGFALDTATGHVYAGLGSSIENADTSCTSQKDCEVLGASELQGGAGVAVDSSANDPPFSGTVYAANTVEDRVDVFSLLFSVETQPASAVTFSGMTLHGTVDPEGVELSECYFEYGTSSEYEHTAACEESPATIGHGGGEVPVQATIKGLRGGTTYHFRLVATRGARVIGGVDLSASTPTVPVIAGAEALNVAAGSAELRATVNPEGSPISRCEFEYVEAAKYKAAAADPYLEGRVVKCEQKLAQIGFGTEPVPVSAVISELTSDTTYHWRLSVKDANGEAYGADHTFVYPTTSSELPDHRAYEMVSPPFKNGASLGTILFGPKYDISEDGSRVVAQSIQCLPGSLSCTAVRDQIEGEPFEFTRTAAGWAPTALSPPASEFSENVDWLFSAGEGMELFSMPTPPAGEDDWYARQPEGSFSDIGPVTPPSAGPSELDGISLPDATADFSHVVWNSDEYVGYHNARAFSIDLTGAPDSGEPIGDCGATAGAPNHKGVNPLSADGRTVFVDVAPCASGSGANAHTPIPAWELYARIDGEEPDAHTVAVSQSQCGAGVERDEVQCRKAAPGDAVFAGASADGSRAFFLDTQQLTDAATEGTGTAIDEGCPSEGARDCNLYLYDGSLPEGERLIDVSAGDTSGLGVGGPEVQGVVAISADGSHVYFVANGVLASGARPGHCNGQKGTCNLYAYERDERYPQGRLAFVASVPGTDYQNWETLGPANVTPDGRFLVFSSHGDLTSDDTRGAGETQIFRYDADQTAREESEDVPALVRVSIGDDGYDDDGNAAVGDASIVPAGILAQYDAGPFRGDPTMSEDGSYVFFQSPIQLTPQALRSDTVIGHDVTEQNGVVLSDKAEYAENVYEYHEGHVYLISDGRDVSATGSGPCAERTQEPFLSDVCLLGAGVTGHDVFFTTSDRLVPADTDTQVDIYDARVCEPESPCIQPAPPPLEPCIGEQCHGIPPARSSLLTGGSETFNGALNPTSATVVPKKVTKKAVTCKRGYVKKKVKKTELCVKTKTKKRAKRASRGRRTQS